MDAPLTVLPALQFVSAELMCGKLTHDKPELPVTVVLKLALLQFSFQCCI
jgi:hypothetical protein